MGFKQYISKKVSATKMSMAHSAALREDIRMDTRKAERESYRKEAVIQARKSGIAKARQPKGLAGLGAGLQKMSKGINKIAPPAKSKGKQKDFLSDFNKLF